MREFLTLYYLLTGALGIFIVTMLLLAIDIIVGWFKDDKE
jgi:hypothetical protein